MQGQRPHSDKWYEISCKRIFTDSEWHRTRMPTARHPPPSIHPHAPLLFATRNDGLHNVVSGRIRPLATSRDPSYLADNRKGPVSQRIRAPFGHDLSQQQRLLAVSAVELDRTILSEPGHVRIAWRVTVAKPPHLKQTQKSTCKDTFRHIS